jgi:hypothetical protein
MGIPVPLVLMMPQASSAMLRQATFTPASSCSSTIEGDSSE